MRLIMGLCERDSGARLGQDDRAWPAGAIRRDAAVRAAYLGAEDAQC